jgi:hypothetical protein
MNLKRLAALFATVLATGLIAGGCGGDDDDGDSGDGTTAPAVSSIPTDISVPTTPEDLDEARDQAFEACQDSLDQVPEEQRDAAEQACETLKSE